MLGKIKVIVLYGGRSTEHDISCRSAAYLLKNLDLQRYEVQPVLVRPDGQWWALDGLKVREMLGDKAPSDCDLRIALDPEIQNGFSPWRWRDDQALNEKAIVFPITHGSFGEDGTLQGYLELMGIPYVGTDTLGSAIAMDKVKAKQLAEASHIDVVPYHHFRYCRWINEKQQILAEISEKFNNESKLFVKPVCSGSSVGITCVEDWNALSAAIDHALAFDEQVLVEKAVQGREIEFAAIGDYSPEISVAGEVKTEQGFYDYQAKYDDGSTADVIVPAQLEASQLRKGQELAANVFQILGLYGFARIDFFLDASNRFYFNEANTLPGFTSISQFPLLWQHSGWTPQKLIDTLINLGLKRARQRKSLRHIFFDEPAADWNVDRGIRGPKGLTE